jgi:hypothetical protein
LSGSQSSPTTAFAQAAVAGTVTDSSGARLRGVLVTASSSALIDALNSSAVLIHDQPVAAGGAWLQPPSIMPPRFVKLTIDGDF